MPKGALNVRKAIENDRNGERIHKAELTYSEEGESPLGKSKSIQSPSQMFRHIVVNAMALPLHFAQDLLAALITIQRTRNRWE